MATYSKMAPNERLFMTHMMMNNMAQQQAPGARQSGNYVPPTGMKDVNKNIYDKYRGPLGKTLQKTMWPAMALSLGVDFAKPISEKVKGFTGKDISGPLDSLMGPLGGLGYLFPSVMSNLLRSKRMGYEKYMTPKLGAVGSASRMFDMYSMGRHMMRTAPAGAAMMAGMPNVAKMFPRPEQFLTGAATGAYGMAKGAAKTVGGLADSATGGIVSKGLKAAGGTEFGKAAGGTLSKVFGGLDSGILSTLGSPMGLGLALAGVQVGLSIMKSIKMARLFPTKKNAAKLANEYSITKQSAQVVAQIDSLAQTGKVKTEQLTYMVLKAIEYNTRASEQQIAGLRADYETEIDFQKQKEDKGTDRFSETYEGDILDQHKGSILHKGMNKIEGGFQTIMNKYNPFHQLANFAVGILSGKMVTPKGEQARIAKTYGFDSEKKMLKEKSAEFGISMPQMKLLTTDSGQIIRMAPTFESKMLAILSAQYDVQRMIASEAITIRKGMGFQDNLMYMGPEKEGLLHNLGQIVKTLDPTNLPVVNAAWNLVKAPFKIIGALSRTAQKSSDWMEKAYMGVRNKLLGKEYLETEDDVELMKKAGLYKSQEERAYSFIDKGLPQHLELIRQTLIMQLEQQENIYNVLETQLEVSGNQYEFLETQADRKSKPLVWDALEDRYIQSNYADELRESRKLQVKATREEAFRQGPLGKIYHFLDLATKGHSKADDFDRSLERMTKTEDFLSRREAGPTTEEMAGMTGFQKFRKKGGLFGKPITYSSDVISSTVVEQYLSGVLTSKARAPFSKDEAEFRRKLQTLPQNIALKMTGIILNLLPVIGPAAYGLGVNFLKRRAFTKREEEIGSRSVRELETEIFSESEWIGKTYEERIASLTGGGIGNIENQVGHLIGQTSNLKVVDKFKDLAKEDTLERIFELLHLGQARVQLVDENLKGLFGQVKRNTAEGPIVDILREITQSFKVGTGGYSRVQIVDENYHEVFGQVLPKGVYCVLQDLAKEDTLKEIYETLTDIYSEGIDVNLMSSSIFRTPILDYLPISIQQEGNKKVTSTDSPHLDTHITNWEGIKSQIPDWNTMVSGGKRFPVDYTTKDDYLKVALMAEGGETLHSQTELVDVNIAMIGGFKVGNVNNLFNLEEYKKIQDDIYQMTKGTNIEYRKEEDSPLYLPRAAAIGGVFEAKQNVIVNELGPEKLWTDNGVSDLGKNPAIAHLNKEGIIVPNDQLKGFAEGGPTKGFKIFEQMKESLQQISKKMDNLNRSLFGIFSSSRQQKNLLQEVKENAEEQSVDQEKYWDKLLNVQEEVKDQMIDQQDYFEKIFEMREEIDQNRTMHQELMEVNEKKEKDESKNTQKGILDTLKGIYGNTKEKLFGKKKDGEKSAGIFDWLMGNIGKVLAGIGIAAAAGYLISKLKDFLFGDKSFGDVFSDIFTSDDPNSVMGVIKNSGKFAGMGAAIGFVSGGVPGMIVGALVGASVGALIQFIKNEVKSEDINKTTTEKIGSFFLGDWEGGIMSAFKTASTYAFIGAGIGMVGGLPGMIAGGLIGAGIGGVIGYIGAQKIGDSFTKALVDNSINTPFLELISKMHGQDSLAYSMSRLFAPLSIPGIIAGWMIGGAMDVGLNILRMFPLGDKAADFIKSKLQPGDKLIKDASNQATTSNPAQEMKFREIQRYNEEAKKIGAQTKSYNTSTGKIEYSKTGDKFKNDQAEQLAGTLSYEPSPTTAGTVGTSAAPSPTKSVETNLPSKTSSSNGTTTTQTTPPPVPANQDVVKAMEIAASKTGMPFDTLVRMAKVESNNFDPKSENPSGAKGLFQFMPKTWKEILTKIGKPKYGLSTETSPFDANASALMGAEYALQNAKTIASVAPNSPPNAVDMYIAHLLGPGGAKNFFTKLNEDPNQPANKVVNRVTPKAAEQNAPYFYSGKKKDQPFSLLQSYQTISSKLGIGTDTSKILAGIKSSTSKISTPPTPTPVTTEPTSEEIQNKQFEARKTEQIITADEAKKQIIAERETQQKEQPKDVFGTITEMFGNVSNRINEHYYNMMFPKTDDVDTEAYQASLTGYDPNKIRLDKERIAESQAMQKAAETSVISKGGSPIDVIKSELDKQGLKDFTIKQNEDGKYILGSGFGVSNEDQDKAYSIVQSLVGVNKLAPMEFETSQQIQTDQKPWYKNLGEIFSRKPVEKEPWSGSPGIQLPINEVRAETVEEKVKLAEEKLKEKAEEIIPEVEKGINDVQQNIVGPALSGISMGSTAPVSIDPAFDSLVERLFSSICMCFNDDFKKYPYENNVNHLVNI